MDFRGKNIDLVGKQNLWFGLSLAVILVGLFSWIAFGLNLGIDFKGGGQLQYRIPAAMRPAPGQEMALLSKVRSGLESKGLQKFRVQVAGGNALVINTDARDDAELRGQENLISKEVASEFGIANTPAKSGQTAGQLEVLSRQLVGPVIGKELRENAIKGVLLGVLLIALWIYIRYNFAGDGLRYAVAGIAALLHDVLVLVGLFALIGHIDSRVEMDSSFIAALLTVVGYSINDSVVIFDRIRENLRKRRKEPFNTVVNDSLLETMSRSINTGMTVLIMLFVLLILGGESIYNFILAMLVGIASGLYSSIFNASMVLTAWHAHDEKKAAAARAARLPAGRVMADRPTPRSTGATLPRSSAALSTSGATSGASMSGRALDVPSTGSTTAATGTLATDTRSVASERLGTATVPPTTMTSTATAENTDADAGSAALTVMPDGDGQSSLEEVETDQASRGLEPGGARRPNRKARAKRRF